MTDYRVISLNGYPLTGLDSFGCLWKTASPIIGWDGSPGSTLTLTQRPRADGSFVGQQPQRKSRVIAPQGTVRTPNEAALQAAFERLEVAASFSAATWSVNANGLTRTSQVRRQDEVLYARVNSTYGKWSLQLSAPDPRKLGTAVSGSTGLPSVSGGLTIPFTVPFVLASTVTAGSIALTNSGTVAGPLSARIDGPVVAPFIQQSTPAGVTRVLSFPNLTLASGEWLAIGDVDTQTVLANGTATRDKYIGSRDWPSFPPGTSTYAFGGTSGSGGLTVTGTPAW